MQNNIQQRISGLLNAYKRNRRWKVLTIILSVAVLCNTFYAMRQAAVAVTDENGETAQISQILENNHQENNSDGTGDVPQIVVVPDTGSGDTTGGDVILTDTVTTTDDTTGGDVTPADDVISGGDVIPGDDTTGGDVISGDDIISGDDVIPSEGGEFSEIIPGEASNLEDGILPGGEDIIEGDVSTDVETELSDEEDDEELPVEWIEQETEIGDTVITVGYFSNAFEIPVYLNAKEITYEEDWYHYEQIREVVEEAAAERDDFVAEGFVAFDIYFHDGSDLYEIEPEEGSLVKVSITMDGEETPDATEVAEVLHIKEENGVLEAEPVVDLYIDVDQETTEFFTDSFTDYVLTKNSTRDAGDMIRAAGEQFAYSGVTRFEVWEKDSYDDPVTQVTQGDTVKMAVGWSANKGTSWYPDFAAGNYIEIRLPDGFRYPADFVRQIPEGISYLSDWSTVNAGEVATITITNGQFLRITFGSKAKDLHRNGNLIPNFFFQSGADNTRPTRQWMLVEIPGVIVTQEPGTFSPYAYDTSWYGEDHKEYHPYEITVNSKGSGGPVVVSGGENIESAEPTAFKVLDTSGKVVRRARTNDAVTSEISWKVTDLTEVDEADDFIEIVLPSELDFPEVSGSFVLTEQYTYTHTDGTQEILWPGTNVAVYTVETKQNETQVLRVQYRLAAVWLNQLDVLAGGVSGSAPNWATVRVENVRIAATSDFTPAVTINDKSKSAERIEIAAPQSGRLNGVNISLRVNGSEEGKDITVGTEDVLKLDVVWDWKSATNYLTSGDYFEVNLPANLEYESFNRVAQDRDGNIFRFQVFKGQDGKWMLRVTYEDVQPGYNKSEGYAPMTAFILTPPDFGGASSATMRLEANVVGQTAKATASITVLNDSSAIPDGEWRIRRGATKPPRALSIFDYSVGNGTIYPLLAPSPVGSLSQCTVKLFVVANHGGTLDTPDPFYDPYKVDYRAGVNYMAAYCADSYAGPPGVYYGSTASQPQYYSRYKKIPIEGAGLNATKVDQLKRIMSTAYPYVDLGTMAKNLGYSSVTVEEATIAVQGAIWRVVNGNSKVNYSNANKIETMIQGLISFQPSTASYRFNGEPQIKFDKARGTATVTGYITPTPVKGLTGTFWGGSADPADVTINERTGYFSATLSGVQNTDTFNLQFNGAVTTIGKVIYFDNIYAASGKNEQDLIAAEPCISNIHLEWQFAGTDVKRCVKAVKRWVDENGAEMYGWPENMTVEMTLYRQAGNGPKEPVGAPVTLSADNPFHSWVDLDATDGKGQVYIYTVEEKDAPDGYELVGIERGTDPYDPLLIVYTATNRKNEKKTNVTVVKEWKDISAQEAGDSDLRVVVQLFRRNIIPDQKDTKTAIRAKNFRDVSANGDGSVYSGDYRTKTTYPNPAGDFGEEVMATLSRENNWTVTFEDLPVLGEDDNKEIDYLIREMAVYEGGVLQDNFEVTYGPVVWKDRYNNEYARVNHDDTARLATVTNTRPEEELTVFKEWAEIVNGQEQRLTENLPEFITAKLSARDASGKEVPAATLIQKYVKADTVDELEIKLNAGNGWSHTWKIFPADGITYYIEETAVPAGYTGPGEAVRFVRVSDKAYKATLKNVMEKQEVTVVKEWNGLTPEEAAEDDLKITVGLFRLKEDGKPDSVRWFPDGNDGRVVVSSDQSGLVLTGTYNIVNTTGVPVQDELNSANGWKVTYRDLPKFDLNGKPVTYVLRETSKLEGFTVSYPNGTVTVGSGVIGLGKTEYGEAVENGQGGLEVKIVNTATGSLQVIKKWVQIDADGNETAFTVNLPEYLDVVLSAKLDGNEVSPETLAQYVNGTLTDGKVVARLEGDNDWSYTWPKVTKLKKLKYYVTEVNLPADYEPVDEDGKTVSADTAFEVKEDQNGVFTVTLTNRRKPAHVTVIKYNADEPWERLDGAEFELYDLGDREVLAVTDQPVATGKKTDTLADPIDQNVIHSTYGASGLLEFNNLKLYNNYYLKETKAAQGYINNSEDMPWVLFRIEVVNGIEKVVIVESHKDIAKSNDSELAISVQNHLKTYELPEAGGAGTKGYIAGGMSLIMATILMYSVLRMLQSRQTVTSGTKEAAVMRKKRKRGASKF